MFASVVAVLHLDHSTAAHGVSHRDKGLRDLRGPLAPMDGNRSTAEHKQL